MGVSNSDLNRKEIFVFKTTLQRSSKKYIKIILNIFKKILSILVFVKTMFLLYVQVQVQKVNKIHHKFLNTFFK